MSGWLNWVSLCSPLYFSRYEYTTYSFRFCRKRQTCVYGEERQWAVWWLSELPRMRAGRVSGFCWGRDDSGGRERWVWASAVCPAAGTAGVGAHLTRPDTGLSVPWGLWPTDTVLLRQGPCVWHHPAQRTEGPCLLWIRNVQMRDSKNI